jgi:hypothetical protein
VSQSSSSTVAEAVSPTGVGVGVPKHTRYFEGRARTESAAEWAASLAWSRTAQNYRTYPVADGDISSEVQASEKPSTTGANPIYGQVVSQLLAEWHGQVTDVNATTFFAQLKGRHGDGVIGQENVAVIPREEVRPDDEELLMPGAFFSLCVSYEISRKGRRRYTEVVFRRLPAFRREELEQAELRGREIARGLRLE